MIFRSEKDLEKLDIGVMFHCSEILIIETKVSLQKPLRVDGDLVVKEEFYCSEGIFAKNISATATIRVQADIICDRIESSADIFCQQLRCGGQVNCKGKLVIDGIETFAAGLNLEVAKKVVTLVVEDGVSLDDIVKKALDEFSRIPDK